MAGQNEPQEDVLVSANELPNPSVEQSLRERARRMARAAQRRASGVRLWNARIRAREAAASTRSRVRRAQFEVGAVARSSATLAGIAKDLARVRAGARHAGASVGRTLGFESATLKGVRTDVARASHSVREDFARLDRDLRGGLAALRPATVEAWRKLQLRTGAAERKAKATLVKSSTLSGLAIDGRRIAHRLRDSRRGRRTRPSH